MSLLAPQLRMNKEETTTGAAATSGYKILGCKEFVRNNPKTDHFKVLQFHHIEFWCGDATNTSLRFSWGFGMPLVAKSDLTTGNTVHASYLIRSGDLRLLFTAPYSPSISTTISPSSYVIPSFSHSAHRSFTSTHGLGVRAVAVEVDSAFSAFSASVSNGAKPVLPPALLSDGKTTIAEVHMYGDVVMRFVSCSSDDEEEDSDHFLPGFEKVTESSFEELDYGIRRLDHAVGNVPELGPVVEYLKKWTGFHEFGSFTAEDVGTEESGMNSVVLANNDENVLVTVNEPVYGTIRKSNIEGYLDHNEGAGVQHLALITEDIFWTLREMKKRSKIGGFEFMPPPPPTYYDNVKARMGNVLTDDQIQDCQKLGILVDKDDEGALLQTFTKPVGDRPTIFIEIIQRMCMLKDGQGKFYDKGGCGGFGKGNFAELYKSIEEYDKILEAKAKQELIP